MYTLFLAGGCASGKSTVAEHLASKGAKRCDLDRLSRVVLAPGEPCVSKIARVFGADLVDSSGVLNRHLLAERTFANAATIQQLEGIEIPAIEQKLQDYLAHADATVVVVEIPLLDRVEDLIPEADEVAVVVAPMDLRRKRAIARGMDEKDFERRIAQQPSREYLEAHADTVFDNNGTWENLLHQVDSWWAKHEAEGWRGKR